jgi:hypothetical protein
MRQCKAEGCNVTLVTKEKMLHEDWPRDAIDEVFALPNDAPVELFLDLVAHIAKTKKPDRIVALEEFDVVVAALARERSSILECAGLTALLSFLSGRLKSGVKPPHSKERSLYTILLTERQQRCILTQLRS